MHAAGKFSISLEGGKQAANAIFIFTLGSVFA